MYTAIKSQENIPRMVMLDRQVGRSDDWYDLNQQESVNLLKTNSV